MHRVTYQILGSLYCNESHLRGKKTLSNLNTGNHAGNVFHFHALTVNACFTVMNNIDNNLALNKPANQISTYTYAVASRAVDGRLDTESCTMPAEVHPWLSVDLGAAYDIGLVTVTHDTNPNFGNYLGLFTN